MKNINQIIKLRKSESMCDYHNYYKIFQTFRLKIVYY
jgi:hypothetical protein